MSDNAIHNIGQTNAENSAEHRIVEERGETLKAVPITLDPNVRPGDVWATALTDAEKLDYLYQVALKVGALVDSISPAQVEQVKRIQSNPLISKLFAGIVKG